jgi:hypothetical protein
MEKNKLADIEQNLKAAMRRHAEATTQRDEAAAGMREANGRKVALETKRAELLRQPFGRANTLADTEIEIAQLDEQIAGHRAALIAAQPLIGPAAAEVVDLRKRAQAALAAALEPVRDEQVARFDAAVIAVVNAAGAITAVQSLLGAHTTPWADGPYGARLPHPITGKELARTAPAIEGIIERLAPLRSAAQLIRSCAGIAPPQPEPVVLTRAEQAVEQAAARANYAALTRNESGRNPSEQRPEKQIARMAGNTVYYEDPAADKAAAG